MPKKRPKPVALSSDSEDELKPKRAAEKKQHGKKKAIKQVVSDSGKRHQEISA